MLINLSKPYEPKIQAQYPILSTIYLSFTTFTLRVHGMDIEVKFNMGSELMIIMETKLLTN